MSKLDRLNDIVFFNYFSSNGAILASNGGNNYITIICQQNSNTGEKSVNILLFIMTSG